jgi:hypothetical protein
MAVSLTHTTVAVGTDAGNGEIRKAQWNEGHTLSMATARLLGRTTAGTGAVEEISAGNGLTLSGGVLAGPREVLTADRTYYVRSDGNNSNTGLANTSGGAFATLQYAYDTAKTLDCAGFSVTIKIGHTATLTSGLEIDLPLINGFLIIEGDTTTPSNTVISTTSATCIANYSYAFVDVKGLALQTTTGGNCLLALGAGSEIYMSGLMQFGACALNHMSAEGGGVIFGYSNYTITGGAQNHLYAVEQGGIKLYGQTVTLSGTPAFSSHFCYASALGFVSHAAVTHSGSATGNRYGVNLNAVVATLGGGASYFPGDAAGYTANGGQYA